MAISYTTAGGGGGVFGRVPVQKLKNAGMFIHREGAWCDSVPFHSVQEINS